MHRRLALLLGFILPASLLGGCAGDHQVLTSEQTGRARSAIVGGETNTGDPAVVELLVNGEGECTASIISPHVALTAGHCILEDVEPGSTFAIFTGHLDSDRTTGETIPVKATHVHSAYDVTKDTSRADVAVVILERPAKDIAPLPWNKKALEKNVVGKPARIIGYGDNTVKEPTSGEGTKRQATTPIVSIDTDWVILGSKTQNQCYGDSGGPVLLAIDGVETIIGVDSWQKNDNCDSINNNTRLDTFADFIAQHVRDNDPSTVDDDDGNDGDDDDTTTTTDRGNDKPKPSSEDDEGKTAGGGATNDPAGANATATGCTFGAASSVRDASLEAGLILGLGLVIFAARRRRV